MHLESLNLGPELNWALGGGKFLSHRDKSVCPPHPHLELSRALAFPDHFRCPLQSYYHLFNLVQSRLIVLLYSVLSIVYLLSHTKG